MSFHLFQSASTPRPGRSPSISSTQSNNSNVMNFHQAPTTKPPTPPVNHQMGPGSGTIGRAAGGHYRTPVPAVAPPMAPATMPASHPPPPQGNFPPQQYASHSSHSSDTYSPSSTLVIGAVHSPPMTGMGQHQHPMHSGMGYNTHNPNASHNMAQLPQAPLMHPPDAMGNCNLFFTLVISIIAIWLLIFITGLEQCHNFIGCLLTLKVWLFSCCASEKKRERKISRFVNCRN